MNPVLRRHLSPIEDLSCPTKERPVHSTLLPASSSPMVSRTTICRISSRLINLSVFDSNCRIWHRDKVTRKDVPALLKVQHYLDRQAEIKYKSYYHSLNHFEPERRQWPNQRNSSIEHHIKIDIKTTRKQNFLNEHWQQ